MTVCHEFPRDKKPPIRDLDTLARLLKEGRPLQFKSGYLGGDFIDAPCATLLADAAQNAGDRKSVTIAHNLLKLHAIVPSPDITASVESFMRSFSHDHIRLFQNFQSSVDQDWQCSKISFASLRSPFP
jgi:hypothetical protein